MKVVCALHVLLGRALPWTETRIARATSDGSSTARRSPARRRAALFGASAHGTIPAVIRLRSAARRAFRRHLLRPLLIAVLAAALALFVLHEATEEDLSSALIACLALSVLAVGTVKPPRHLSARPVRRTGRQARQALPTVAPLVRPTLTRLRL